jgi:choline kinase
MPHPQSQTNTRPQAISRPQSSYFDTGSSLTTEPSEMTDPADEEEIEAEITGLMHEARLWRLANSAQWVAWGVVQAHVPGLEHLSVAPALETSSSTSSAQTTPRVQPATEDTPSTHAHPSVSVSGGSDPLTGDAAAAAQDLADKRPEEADAAEEDEGFDYLSYARERALFFWGDALQFGFVTEEELEVFGLGVGVGAGSGSGGVKVVDF